MDHNFEVNWGPLSEVTCNCKPKRATQLYKSALAQVSASVVFSGIASGHLVNRSTIIKRYVNPCDGGSGPAKST